MYCQAVNLYFLCLSLQTEVGQALEQAAQGCDGLPIPGGIEEMCGYGTEICGLVVELSRSN